MERRRIVESLTATAVVAALALSACAEDNSTVEEQLNATYEAAVELCTDQAQDAYATEFVDVDNNPATPVDEAYEANARRTAEGDEFLNASFTECLDTNYFAIVAGLKTQMPEINPVESDEQTPVTTEQEG